MCREDVDFQAFFEIGHVLSNVRELRIMTQTAAPGAPVDSAQHDVTRRRDRGAQASGDDDGLQVGLINNQCLAAQTEATGLVQKNEPQFAGMFDVNDQRDLSNPRGQGAAGALREAFANVRVEHE